MATSSQRLLVALFQCSYLISIDSFCCSSFVPLFHVNHHLKIQTTSHQPVLGIAYVSVISAATNVSILKNARRDRGCGLGSVLPKSRINIVISA